MSGKSRRKSDPQSRFLKAQRKILKEARKNEDSLRYAIHYKEFGKWRLYDAWPDEGVRDRTYKWLVKNNPGMEMRRTNL